ncbi:hypothetical protein ML462_11040 [Gramella lutea]|uniref:Uncharacterized protein n=1 Tax=Christiangramia lutea TaxID=1607951 RepID=A0A9X2A9U8_9FLAO|nr:hypothetical protein [Christiangramia lutea]MCH4823705.1 hypothetical protein [Christiangramia lutea]
MWDVIVEFNLWPTYLFEFIAALAGLTYLWKTGTKVPDERFLIHYLVFIFLADLFILIYSTYGYVYKFQYLEFILGTPFQSQFWLYNILILGICSSFIYYFILLFESRELKRLFKLIIVFYLLSSIVAYFIGDFFKSNDYSFSMGSILICIAIGAYYLEILKSHNTLEIHKKLCFYVSIGLLVYNLCLIPMHLFQDYVQSNSGDSEFYQVYNMILKLSNFFMYSMFTIGFAVEYYWMRKSKIQKSI